MEDSEDESLSRQVLNMILENNAITPWIAGWAVFQVILLALLIYISIRISLK
jgi:hypothetical protein